MKACYIHVPFCKNICSYCDFTRCRYHEGLASRWLTRIQSDITTSLVHTKLETIYIGGGTPSALSTPQLISLLQSIQPYTSNIQEYTMEANIDSLSNDKLEVMHRFGVNRISLGVQTLQSNILAIIQRTSSRDDALQVIQQIHEHGIDNISIDLMYGLPEQTMQQWKDDLFDIVTNFEIDHISLYALTIEEHSQFGRDGVQAMDENMEADMFEYAISFLEQHGFEHYEISNFARHSKRSKHNQTYWKYEDFVAIGCGASGKQHHRRYDNTHNLQTYFDVGATPSYTELTKEDEMFETMMMGLRTKDGVSITRFKEVFHEDIKKKYAHVIREEIALGRLRVEGDFIKTSYQGMMLLHDILVKFLQD